MSNVSTKKKKRQTNPDSALWDAIRAEHAALGKKIWGIEKKRGSSTKTRLTIAQKVDKLNVYEEKKTWLDEKAEKVIKFYSNPIWWLNPVNWFKAGKMSKDRQLCVYAASQPHVSIGKGMSLWVAPIKQKHNFVLDTLLGLRRMFAKWGEVFKKRNISRQQNMEKEALEKKKDELTGVRAAEHAKWVEKEYLRSHWTIEKVEKRAAKQEQEHQKRLRQIEEEGGIRRQAIRVEGEAFVARLEAKRVARESREIYARNGWMRQEVESDILLDTQSHLRELEPVIAKLKAMMAAVWVCQVTGNSTLDRVAAVLAEHDRIAARHHLVREGLNYHCMWSERRESGGDLQSNNPHIINQRTCGSTMMRA